MKNAEYLQTMPTGVEGVYLRITRDGCHVGAFTKAVSYAVAVEQIPGDDEIDTNDDANSNSIAKLDIAAEGVVKRLLFEREKALFLAHSRATPNFVVSSSELNTGTKSEATK